MCSGPLTSITRCLDSYQPQSSENRKDIFFLFLGAGAAGEMLFLSPELSPDETLSSSLSDMPLHVRRSSDPALLTVNGPFGGGSSDLPVHTEGPPSRKNPTRWSTTAGFLKARHSSGTNSLERKVSLWKNLSFLRSLKVEVHPNTLSNSVILAGQSHGHVPQPAAGRWHVGQSERVPEGDGPLVA